MTGASRPSRADVDAHLRRELRIPVGVTLEAHIAGLTPEQRVDAVERLARSAAAPRSQKGHTANGRT